MLLLKQKGNLELKHAYVFETYCGTVMSLFKRNLTNGSFSVTHWFLTIKVLKHQSVGNVQVDGVQQGALYSSLLFIN